MYFSIFPTYIQMIYCTSPLFFFQTLQDQSADLSAVGVCSRSLRGPLTIRGDVGGDGIIWGTLEGTLQVTA